MLAVDDVARVAAAGGRVVISPNRDPEVNVATEAHGLISLPAFFRPSEAFRAIAAGADALKLFPAEAAGPAMLRGIRAVIPVDSPVLPVGGIDSATIPAYRAAGATGFDVGSSLYTPGRDGAKIRWRGAELAVATPRKPEAAMRPE